MKKIISLLIMCLLFGTTIFAYAQTGGFEDERVNYIYWDQNEIQTYWTGVTNKVNYDWYAPCVGAKNAGVECGEAAQQGRYKEFGLAVYVSHVHGLLTSYGQLEYIIE